jgi:hypothetical protein
MNHDEALRRLRVNALAVHQRSIGRSDELVRILERTVGQVEKTHDRVKLLSTLLFVAGLALLAAAAAAILAGQQELWAAAIGGVGGLAAVAAVFWTGPLEQIATSVGDLVKLEAAFLGYIRLIGEIDSYFQMQYLAIVSAPESADKSALSGAIFQTTNEMKTAMTHGLGLIDQYVAQSGEATTELKKELDEATARIQKLEASGGQAPASA